MPLLGLINCCFLLANTCNDTVHITWILHAVTVKASACTCTGSGSI